MKTTGATAHKHKKLSYVRDSSRYDKISDSGRSAQSAANPNRNYKI